MGVEARLRLEVNMNANSPLKSELGEIVRFYSLRGIRYETILGKGVLGKRLAELLNAAPVRLIAPPDSRYEKC